ncbi:MAG: hypothetical protein AB7V56_13700 [Candidatus Nitrosocosmicus sp.]
MKITTANVLSDIASLKTTIPLAFKLVFTNPFYFALSAIVFTIFWIVFNVFDQLLFFSPVLYFYIPDDAQIGFVITNITSALLGMLIAMNIYTLRNSKIELNRSGLTGSLLSIVSSACASCSSFGFLIISLLGGTGIIATSLLTNYQIPLRIVSIVILLWALYTVTNKIAKPCIFDPSKNNGKKKNKNINHDSSNKKTTTNNEL